MAKSGTVFNDPIHGYIELEPLLVKVIHTPQFQRMKDIKQLGASYWVYPGASHNRFEHSLGTAHLAGKMIEILRQKHENEFEISDNEVLCVKLAALCHDLGHGPFSHVFDHQMKRKLIEWHMQKEHELMKLFKKTKSDKEAINYHREHVSKLSNWSHEDASCEMFDYLVETNPNVKKAFEDKKLSKIDLELVKELIKGKNPDVDIVKQTVTINGVEYKKSFLFEIVANKRNGIDCDKFDYFARDCHNLGVKSNFDHLRYFQNVHIFPVDGELQLCVRDKLVFNIYEMFHTRWSLHHRVYQHKTIKAIEDMITDAFVIVNDKYKFSEAISNMEEYSKLTDCLFYEIIRCKDDDENVRNAKKILEKIQRRELYKFCGETQLKERLKIDATEVAEEIASFDDDLNANELFVSVIEIDFGKKDEDPVESVVFFNKDEKPVQIRKNIVSGMLPSKFSERFVRVYGKALKETNVASSPNSKEIEDTIVRCFQKWCQKHKCAYADELSGDKTGYFTPAKGRKRVTLEDQNNEVKTAKRKLYNDTELK